MELRRSRSTLMIQFNDACLARKRCETLQKLLDGTNEKEVEKVADEGCLNILQHRRPQNRFKSYSSSLTNSFSTLAGTTDLETSSTTLGCTSLDQRKKQADRHLLQTGGRTG